jgi:hypothetical protein
MEISMPDEGTRIGRPPDFSVDQIVAERIEARTQRVNGFRLRTELGGGNASRLMDVWTRHENERIDASAKTNVDLPFALVPHAEAVSEAAAVEAKRNAEALYSRMYTEINGWLGAQYKHELEEAKDSAASAKIAIDEADAKLEKAYADIGRLTAEKEQLSALNARLEERAAQLEKAVEAARTAARQAHLDAVEMVAAARSEIAAEIARQNAVGPEITKDRGTRTRER